VIAFYILSTDNTIPIENMPNKNIGHEISKATLDLLFDSWIDGYKYVFIVNNDYDPTDMLTVGESSKNTISIVNDFNVDQFTDPFENALLMVNDVENLYTNFSRVFPLIKGSIEIKPSFDTNLDALDVQLEKIVDHLSGLKDNKTIVKNLNSFFTKEKFNLFGERAFFVDTEGYVYYHPAFYYEGLGRGKICRIDEFAQRGEEAMHFSRPHLVCLNCETFYCDRNVYLNKIKTTEYKVPCEYSCKLTSLFMKHSKVLFERLYGDKINTPDNLDRVADFAIELEYDNLVKNRSTCNRIKGMDFSQRIFKQEEYNGYKA